MRFPRMTPARTWTLSVLLVPVLLVLFVWMAHAMQLEIEGGVVTFLVPIVGAAAFVACSIGIWRSSSHWSLKILATVATPVALSIGILIALAVLFAGVR